MPLLLAGTATLVVWPGLLRSLFSANFLPHGTCYLWNRPLVWLHLTSDVLIWLSYIAISCTLVYLERRMRKDIPFQWVYLAFGAFIVACGFTHLMEGIGIALDFKGNRMFVTDLAGNIVSAKLDGTEKKPLLVAQGNLTGIAYAEIP